jgi:hypothetical protein
MALLFCDGFDHYASADILKKWTVANAVGSCVIDPTAGRRGGGAFTTTTGGRGNPGKTLAASYATLVAGVALNLSGPISGSGVLWFADAGTTQVVVIFNADGTFSVKRGSTVLATSSVAIGYNAYNYIELKATIHPSAGAIELRLNGVAIITASGINTRATANSSANGLYIGIDSNPGGSFNATFDDLYLCDTSGSTNNNFLGDCRIDTLFPNADGTYSGFTPSTGTAHWSTVDDAMPNITDYVSAGVASTKDSYGFTDLTSAASVFGVQVCNAALKDDAGARSVANLVRSGSTDAQGPTVALSTSQLIYTSIHETDPATSAAWTQSGVNAAQFGTVVAA